MTKNYFPYSFFEGGVVKTEAARVSVMTNALQYGTAFFGGIRGYYSKNDKKVYVFRLIDHLERLQKSARILGVKIKYSAREMKDIVLDLIKKNQPRTDVYMRPFVYAASTKLSPNLNSDPVFELALYMIPLGEYLSVDKGLSVCVSSWTRVSDNQIPTRAKISGSYINSALARTEADKRGFDEAIFLTREGYVTEGSAENLFLVRNGVLVTPPKTDDILEGITRSTVMTMAQDMNVSVEERSINRTELYVADEAFFSGTGVQVAWIAKVDDRLIGNGKRGPVTESIQKLFFDIVKGKNTKYKNWLTEVSW